MIDSYLTISDSALHKITRKKSRFIVVLSPASSLADVEQQMAGIRRAYHDATHHCFAYRLLGNDDVAIEASSDDGEPSGSAGIPMLQQLAGRDICNVLAVVIRYYGGVNLGVGGLMRAYSDAVSEALDHAPVVRRAIQARITIRFPVEVNSGVMSTVHRFSAHVENVLYDESVCMEVTLPPSQVDGFRAALIEATGARTSLEVLL